MGNQQQGTGGLPEPPDTYPEELVDELDSDLEPETDDLKQLWQPVYQANQQSLERVYARLQSIESIRPPVSPATLTSRQEASSPTSTAKGALPMNTIKTTMPTPKREPSSPSRRNSFSPSRLTKIAAVLATGLLLTGTLLGFLYFRGGRPAQTGPTPQLSAKLECRAAPFADEGDGLIVLYGRYDMYSQTPLDWSTPEDIAYTGPTLIWNPKTCHSTPSQPNILAAMNSKTVGDLGGQIVFSPDGKRVIVIGGTPGWVLDTHTGSIITQLQMSGDALTWSGYGQAIWTDGGSQIVTVTTAQQGAFQFSYKIQQWDSRTGALIRTAINFPFQERSAGLAWISPDATHAAILLANHSLQFWNIATGQLISTTPAIAMGSAGTVAWSPDGSYFAFGINSANPSVTPGQTQIWSSRTGQLVITLPDTDTFHGMIDALSWSPNGRYLAESSGQITIWNTSTWQQAAVFDIVATSTRLGHSVTRYEQVETLAWSPDSSELASMTHSYDAGGEDPHTRIPTITNDNLRLSVWKLTPVSAPTAQPATPSLVPTETPGPSSTPTPTTGTSATPIPTQSATPSPTETPAGPGTPTPTPVGSQ